MAIGSRWKNDENFDLYGPCIIGINPLPPDVKALMSQFRAMILQAHVGQGLGRMPAEAVYQRGQQDVDAIVDFLGDRPFFMGTEPRSIDAALASMLKHTTYVPFEFPLKDYARSSHSLGAYCQRLDDRFASYACSVLAAFIGPFSTAAAEQFSAGVRSTGLAPG